MPVAIILSDGAMVKRLTVTLDDALLTELEKIASEQERTAANLLAYLGRECVKQWKKKAENDEQRNAPAR